jgi:hypothetical protein
MLKHLMSGGSLLSYALYDGNNDEGSAKDKLREQIAKGNLPEGQAVIKEGEEDGNEPDPEEDEEDEEENEPEPEAELTKEEKAAKAEADKLAAKAKRKEDRVQKRFNELTAAKATAEAEVARLKAQLEADPEKKLTEEEIESRAEAKAAQKQAAKDLAEMQTKFEAACDKLQAEARKVDKDFDDKINDIATDVGPIPSFMIGILEDLDNGGEVLAFIANDDELAERIYGLKTKPAKMTKELVEISNKLEAEKKKPKKQISKVPDPVKPVNGSRANNSVTLTEADTKDMDTYVRKRQAQMMEQRKLRGFG